MTTDKPFQEDISVERFNSLQRSRGGPSPQCEAIRAMAVGSAMILGHEPLKCYRGKPRDNGHGTGTGCSFQTMLSFESKNSTSRRYAAHHLPDGRVAVACIAKEGHDNKTT
jgi:hypothetical protein